MNIRKQLCIKYKFLSLSWGQVPRVLSGIPKKLYPYDKKLIISISYEQFKAHL